MVSNEVLSPTCNVDLGREHIGSGCKRRDKTSVAECIGDEQGAPDGDASTLHGGCQAKPHVSQDKTARLGAAQAELEAAETEWLELEMLREELRRSES